MNIKSSFEYGGNTYGVEWYDADNFDDLPYEQCNQVYAIAYNEDDKVVLVTYDNDHTNLPGGGIENGESYEQTLRRELLEEINCEVIDWKPVGYQVVIEPNGKRVYQARVVARVKHVGDFAHDIGGEVTGQVKVEPEKVNETIGYGDVGEQMMARAADLVKALKR